MTIVIDQANVGETGVDSASSTIVVTTGATVAVNSIIIGTLCWLDTAGSPTLSSVSGGSLTWAIDKQGAGGAGTAASAAVISAQAPSGLASGTTITATLSGSSGGGRSFALTSFTGVLSASPLGNVSGPTDFTATTAWTSASTTISAGSVLVAVAPEFNSNFTSTITGPSVEAHDINVGPAQFSCTTGYRINASAGATTVAGTWSSSCNGTVVAAEYKAAPTVLALPILVVRQAVNRSSVI